MPTSPPRMAWLDGLRAVAVLMVVYAHFTHYAFRDVRAFTADWINPGPAGVMIFFLVSGYIIPASLERHGDLRRFWISRLFRLMPLYVVICGIVIAVGLDPDLNRSAIAAHLTMLPLLLGVGLATPVIWTLTYEMAFYLLVTALFALRARRLEGPVAVAFAVAAVVFAPLVPAGLRPVITASVLLAAGLIAVSSRRRWAVVGGGLVLGGLAVVLLALNQDLSHRWDGLLILAVMFTGTLIHRADHGRASWWQVGVVGAVVAGCLLANWFAELRSLNAFNLQYAVRSVITLLVIAGSFAIGMAFRHRHVPRWLAWIGLVSFSVYLVHYVLIQALRPLMLRLGDHLYVGVGYLALMFTLSWLTYRWIEVPFQKLGRRLTAPPTARLPDPETVGSVR